MQHIQTPQTGAKSRWIDPEIKRLDLLDTQLVPRRGTDGSVHADCTRS